MIAMLQFLLDQKNDDAEYNDWLRNVVNPANHAVPTFLRDLSFLSDSASCFNA